MSCELQCFLECFQFYKQSGAFSLTTFLTPKHLQDLVGQNRNPEEKDEVIIMATRLHNASCFTRTIGRSSVSFMDTTINKEPSVYARDWVFVCAFASVMRTMATFTILSRPVCLQCHSISCFITETI